MPWTRKALLFFMIVALSDSKTKFDSAIRPLITLLRRSTVPSPHVLHHGSLVDDRSESASGRRIQRRCVSNDEYIWRDRAARGELSLSKEGYAEWCGRADGGQVAQIVEGDAVRSVEGGVAADCRGAKCHGGGGAGAGGLRFIFAISPPVLWAWVFWPPNFAPVRISAPASPR